MNDEKTALGRKILKIKKQKGLTWSDVAARLGHAPVFVCAACLGQMSFAAGTAEKAAALFGLDAAEAALLAEPPYRGSLPTAVPTDPLIYRFYELVMVYGTTWKEMIQEEFGDGIMSAIDFDMTMERQPDQKGDRVKLTMSGKFLPYKRVPGRCPARRSGPSAWASPTAHAARPCSRTCRSPRKPGRSRRWSVGPVPENPRCCT